MLVHVSNENNLSLYLYASCSYIIQTAKLKVGSKPLVTVDRKLLERYTTLGIARIFIDIMDILLQSYIYILR